MIDNIGKHAILAVCVFLLWFFRRRRLLSRGLKDARFETSPCQQDGAIYFVIDRKPKQKLPERKLAPELMDEARGRKTFGLRVAMSISITKRVNRLRQTGADSKAETCCFKVCMVCCHFSFVRDGYRAGKLMGGAS